MTKVSIGRQDSYLTIMKRVSGVHTLSLSVRFLTQESLVFMLRGFLLPGQALCFLH